MDSLHPRYSLDLFNILQLKSCKSTSVRGFTTQHLDESGHADDLHQFNNSLFKRHVKSDAKTAINRNLIAQHISVIAPYEKEHYNHAEVAISVISSLPMSPDLAFLHYAISAYGRYGDPKRLKNALDQMQKLGCEPSRFSMNCLIESFAMIGDVAGIEGAIERMKALDLDPNVSAIQSLLADVSDSTLRIRNIEGDELDELGSSGGLGGSGESEAQDALVRERSHYHRMLQHANGNTSRIEKLLNYMLTDNIPSTVDSLNYLMEAYADNNNPIEAQRVFDEICALGTPSYSMFEKLIAVHSINGDHAKVEKVIDIAIEAGAIPGTDM